MIRRAWPVWLGILALTLWIVYALFALSTTSPDWTPGFLMLPDAQGTSTIATRGQFGDAFGAFNALVSTFALIGLFFTIRSQQHQLTEQSKAAATSERLTRQQQFQEFFYRAVDTYKQLLSEISSSISENEQAVHGRVALWKIWRERFIAALPALGETELDIAIRKQLEAYANETLGEWNTNAESASAIAKLKQALATTPGAAHSASIALGGTWAHVYSVNRFQLDSLFRAWYTAYRVLSTASSYGLDDDTIRLYSATFRAQLSWIEMAFLLANQAGLPGNMSFPNACWFSNKYVIFDNLDTDSDAVVATLAWIAQNQSAVAPDKSARLSANAFGIQAMTPPPPESRGPSTSSSTGESDAPDMTTT